MVTEAAVWDALAEIPDPEIPVISLVDLGVVKDVAVVGDQVRIEFTPTFMGCPALDTMRRQMEEAVTGLGGEPQVDVLLDDSWSTDRITPEGREKLREAGFAAEVQQPLAGRGNAQALGAAVIGVFGALDQALLDELVDELAGGGIGDAHLVGDVADAAVAPGAVEALAPRSVASTDHVPFDAIGVPAFQFMVDRLEYNSRSHHSNMDTVDRVQRDDMVQHATVIAVFAYNAAMRDGKLPRKALPRPQGRGTQQTGASR